MRSTAIATNKQRIFTNVLANGRDIAQIAIAENNCSPHTFFHGTTIRTTADTDTSNRRVIAAVIASAADTRTMAWLLAEVCMKTPRPRYAPTYSPTIAPVIA